MAKGGDGGTIDTTFNLIPFKQLLSMFSFGKDLLSDYKSRRNDNFSAPECLHSQSPFPQFHSIIRTGELKWADREHLEPRDEEVCECDKIIIGED